MFNCTAHSALTNPVVVGVVANGCPAPLPSGISRFAGGAHPTQGSLPSLGSGLAALSTCTALHRFLQTSDRSLVVANVISPPDPVLALIPSLNSSKIVGSVPSPISSCILSPLSVPVITPNGPYPPLAPLPTGSSRTTPAGSRIQSAYRVSAYHRLIFRSQQIHPAVIKQEDPATFRSRRASHRSLRVFGSPVNRRSVGPSCRSNGTTLLPIGLAGFSG